MLLSRTIIINGRKMPVKLCKNTWEGIDFISKNEGIPLYKLCSIIDQVKGHSSISLAIHLFTVAYFNRLAMQHEQPIIDTVPVFRSEEKLSPATK